VTGGSRGIGAAIVRAFHADGYAVFFTFARMAGAAEALVRELGDERCVMAPCELSSADLPAAVQGCVDRFGALDVLINNAGTFAENRFDGDDFDRWRAGWQRTFAVNLFGAADLAWLALRAMRANPAGPGGTRGRIVNVTSRAAHRGELEFPDYGASKAALANLTRSLARGCASDGIVAFNVAPGFIETDMAADALREHGDVIRAEIPGGRVGTPAEVAGIVLFLASGAADYATGTTIDVNGASYVR
jgi:NAD(P)-dependent dehydrogenase (short-subunit alcohol dehydrogenase family)